MKKILIFLAFLSAVQALFADKIHFSASRMTGRAGDVSSRTELTGNAQVKTSVLEIQADSIELYGKEFRFIKASGKVSGKNLETNMTFNCDELEYDRDTKIATLRGNVSLVDVDNAVTAQAQVIEYDQNAETAVLQIQINLTQKDNICSGSYAIYYKKRQVLEISGNAQVKQDDDVFRAQHITLDMETQDITLGGNVKGSIIDKEEPEPEKSTDTLEDGPEND